MNNCIKMLCAVSVTVAATACHKGDDGPGTKQCFLNQRCELLEGQSAEITDTTTSVWNSQTNSYEHPVYTAKFEKIAYDNRAWGDMCGIADFGRVNPVISLSGKVTSVTDTFNYGQCVSYDLPTDRSMTHVTIDSAQLYLLRVHPLPLPRTFEKEDHPYSVEFMMHR